MAIEFGKDRAQDFAPANLMSFGKSFSRMGAQPLDMNEVWYDLDALKNYAKTNATAYVGMRLVHADSATGKITVYAIKNTAGDLLQIASADDIQTAIDAIVFPEDTNTTYGFAFDKATQKITITPSEGKAVELDLSDFLIASDLPEDKNTEYHLEYSSEDKAIKLVAGADANKMSIDATPFIKDGMLSDVEYDAASNTLTFVWNTDAGLQADTVVLSDILDPYIAGDKIVIDGSKISHATMAAPALVEGGSGRTYITELISDGFGHITGYKVATETVVDTNENDTYSAGNGINVSDADENDNHIVSVKIADTENRLSFDENGGLQVDVSGIDTNDTYSEGNGIAITDDGGETHTVSVKLASGEQNLVVNANGLATNFDLDDYVTKESAGVNNAEKPGIRFINQEEINKLSALSLDGEDVTISGSVEAAQVKGLYAVVKNIVTGTPGSEDFDPEATGIQQALGIESGAQKNFINSASDDFVVSDAGHLSLANDYVTTKIYAEGVGDLSKLKNRIGSASTLVDEINAINDRLTWVDMD